MLQCRMLRLLAFDTSTEACSVALCVGTETVSRDQRVPQKQSEFILPMIDEVLAEASLSLSQLDAIAFGQGPGSFMGLRIALGVAKGLAYGVDCPLIAISSLQSLAQSAYQHYAAEQVVAALDARMQAMYWGVYEIDSEKVMQTKIPDALSAPAELTLPQSEVYVAAGNAWSVYEAELTQRLKTQLSAVHPELYSEAKAMLVIAAQKYQRKEWTSAEAAEPSYIRDQVTHS